MFVKFEIFRNNILVGRSEQIVDCRFSEISKITPYCLHQYNLQNSKNGDLCRGIDEYPECSAIPTKMLYFKEWSFETIKKG